MNDERGPETLNLTARELQVCQLVAELKNTTRIAFDLGISERTVEAHIYSAARQLPGKGQPMKRIIRYFASSGKLRR